MATPTQASVQFYPGYSQQIIIENLVWRTIGSISNSYPMIVTTVLDHGYPAGIRVRFNIPSMFGMTELKGVEVQVLAVTSNTLSVNLDSSNFAPFAYPASLPEAYTPPVVIPDASGAYLPPLPLIDPNQTSFEGVIFNNGALGNTINGM
jgi:hypothetical protein